MCERFLQGRLRAKGGKMTPENGWMYGDERSGGQRRRRRSSSSSLCARVCGCVDVCTYYIVALAGSHPGQAVSVGLGAEGEGRNGAQQPSP